MFLWDLVVNNVMEQFMDWVYGQLISLFTIVLGGLSLMGAELFEMDWIMQLVDFFAKLGWSLYIAGFMIAVFDFAIEYQNGKGSIQDTCINVIKGFFSVSLFTIVPVELYRMSVHFQMFVGIAIAGSYSTPTSINLMALSIITTPFSGGINLYSIVLVILIGYAVIRVFFDNLRRGGILLTMIAVGSLYQLSVPRGYMDGFTQWAKQVVALCITTFLQSTVLALGLLTYNVNPIMGIGLILSATEVPRIAQNFGLETSTRGNVMQTFYAAQGAVSIANTVSRAVGKASTAV